MNEELIKKYYNKFNEDKRLNTRHGMIEFNTSIKYILKYAKKFNNPSILDIGCGTGKYSLYLKNLGYDVTCIDLVKHNLRVIESKNKGIKTYLGSATKLDFLANKKYDIILLFGPLYHLYKDEKIKAIKEAMKHLNKDGYLMNVYCLNDYAILKHGFINKNILKDKNLYDNSYHIIDNSNNLYTFDTLDSIDKINKECHLKRECILSQEGITEYIRKEINSMSEEEFNLYLDFHLKRCENIEYLGIGRHILDIVKM